MSDVAAGFWPIVPTPWVRESNADKYKPRQRVVRYRAFRTEVALRRVWLPVPGDVVVFCMPIPRSWPTAKKDRADGQPHQQVPDVDNLLKALLDACFADDAHIWTITPAKIWSATPGIYIERRAPAIALPFVPNRIARVTTP